MSTRKWSAIKAAKGASLATKGWAYTAKLSALSREIALEDLADLGGGMVTLKTGGFGITIELDSPFIRINSLPLRGVVLGQTFNEALGNAYLWLLFGVIR